jgi:hypothetical protein
MIMELFPPYPPTILIPISTTKDILEDALSCEDFQTRNLHPNHNVSQPPLSGLVVSTIHRTSHLDLGSTRGEKERFLFHLRAPSESKNSLIPRERDWKLRVGPVVLWRSFHRCLQNLRSKAPLCFNAGARRFKILPCGRSCSQWIHL